LNTFDEAEEVIGSGLIVSVCVRAVLAIPDRGWAMEEPWRQMGAQPDY